MAVGDKVKSIIVEQLGVDEEEVTADASFVDDLGADSLDTVELVMALTVMLRDATSLASDLVKPISPAFDAA